MGRPKMKRQTLEISKPVSFTKNEALAIDTLCEFNGTSSSYEIRNLVCSGLIFWKLLKGVHIAKEQRAIYGQLLKNWVHNPNDKDSQPLWVDLMQSDALDKEAKKLLVDLID